MTKSFTAPIITSHNNNKHTNSPPHSTTTPDPTSPRTKYSALTSYQQHQNSSNYTYQQDQQEHRYQVRKHAGSFSSTPTSLSASDDEKDVDHSDSDDGFNNDDGEDNSGKDDDDLEQQDDQESTVLNEARVNRQIADLEISNQSLLAVNAMLEATVRKQASEMAQMKKQMIVTDNGVHVNPLVLPLPTSEISEDEWENDKTFQRLCSMTDKLIEQAHRAISFEFKGMGRVISYSEQQDDDRQLENDNGDDDK
ncbi:hypothetical protein BC941DRAFT_453623 [Chlamydoabsidia padenii]|nr:hypothetical protein BC941DRAFT_453623 [Chlamydoabsidia padenii]